MADIRFLLRQEVKPTYFGGFDVIDIVMFMGSLFSVIPLTFVAEIPLGVSLFITVLPVFLFCLFFRFRKPRGYFTHWVSRMMRPNKWTYQGTVANSLIDLRARCPGVIRPMKDNPQAKSILTLGHGIHTRWEAAKPGSDSNPFVAMVRRDAARRHKS